MPFAFGPRPVDSNSPALLPSDLDLVGPQSAVTCMVDCQAAHLCSQLDFVDVCKGGIDDPLPLRPASDSTMTANTAPFIRFDIYSSTQPSVSRYAAILFIFSDPHLELCRVIFRDSPSTRRTAFLA